MVAKPEDKQTRASADWIWRPTWVTARGAIPDAQAKELEEVRKARRSATEEAWKVEIAQQRMLFERTVSGILDKKDSASFQLQKPGKDDFASSVATWPYILDWSDSVLAVVTQENGLLSVRAGIPNLWVRVTLSGDKPSLFETDSKNRSIAHIRPRIRNDPNTHIGQKGILQFGNDLARYIANHKRGTKQ